MFKRKALSVSLALSLSFGTISSLTTTAFAQQQVFEENEVLKIIPSTQDQECNSFSFNAVSGKSWTTGDSEAYIDLKTTTTGAEECYYTVKFYGNKIDVYATQNPVHGIVAFSIDGGAAQKVDLYDSYKHSSPSKMFTAENLTEGEHVLKAVLTTDAASRMCNQVNYVEVTHAPYTPTSIDTIADVTMANESSYTIRPTYSPSWMNPTFTYTSDNPSVATVDAAGKVRSLSEGTAKITVASGSASQTFTVTVTPAVKDLGGTISDINYQHLQADYEDISEQSVLSTTLSAWKNDTAMSEITLFARSSEIKNVVLSASDFTNGTSTISSDNISLNFIESTKAYNGAYLGYGSPDRVIPADNGTNRSEANDIVSNKTSMTIPSESIQNVLVKVHVPADAQPGTYTGTISANSADMEAPLTFTYTIEVADLALKDASEFSADFELGGWQYPYSVAEYFEMEPFSEEHIAVLKENLELYKNAGGKIITGTVVEESWNGQTYSANDIHYPSMVKWTKNSDGSFSYDYSDLDAWIETAKSVGLGEEIILYSMLPWHSQFTYWENGTLVKESMTYSSDENSRYYTLWHDFLSDFAAHATEKKYMENIYFGCDERNVSNITHAQYVISKSPNYQGLTFKTAADIDNVGTYKTAAQSVDRLNVGDTAATNNKATFNEIKEVRDASGKTTTLYSCTEHRPGNFTLSTPMESYWSVANAGKMDVDGFHRWAWDAWVEDPLRDSTHNSFEPGDCFLVYPTEKEEKGIQTSLRLEMMMDALRDVNKLKTLQALDPSLETEITKVFNKITSTVSTGRTYLTDAEKASIASQVNAFRDGVAAVTNMYFNGVPDPEDTLSEYQVSYYSFDDETVNDSWTAQRHGTYSGEYGDGQSGKALHITTAGQGAVLGEKPEGYPADQGDWSISYWVKADSLTDNTRSFVTSDSTTTFSTALRIGSDARSGINGIGLRVTNSDGGWLTYVGGGAEEDTWYHMVWTQSAAEGMSLYLNGEFIQLNTWTKNNSIKFPMDVIGSVGFTGYIDEVKVFSKVVDADEVASLMALPGLNVSITDKYIVPEEQWLIKATVVSENPDKSLVYESLTPDIVSVNARGLVTGLDYGQGRIKVSNPSTGMEQIVNVTVIRFNSEHFTNIDLPEQYLSDVEGPYYDANGAVASERRYLGQPDMTQTASGKLITVFPTGHGHGALIMKESLDGGDTWTEKTDIPASWAQSQETPTIYTLDMTDGTQKLILITANPTWDLNRGGWMTTLSDDDGETWKEENQWHATFSDGSKRPTIVAMSSLVQLKDENGNFKDEWMGIYHNYSYVNYKTILSFDEDGNEQWSEPEPILSQWRSIESTYQMCEIGMFRSPDGKRIVGLARSQSHNNPSTLIYSDDEGETWSKPMDLPGCLAGERHKAVYDPDTGRLVITMRQIRFDLNKNNEFDGSTDWHCGHWVAWVGTYEDLISQKEGEYLITLGKDYANNAKGGDTGYSGMTVLADGTMVFDTYGHWDESVSSQTTNVTQDLCWIRQAKFKLADIDALVYGSETVDKTVLENAVLACAEIYANLDNYEDGPEKAAFLQALANAKTVYENEQATQEEINSAAKAVNDAKDALVEKQPEAVIDYSLLRLVTNAANALSQSDYSTSLTALKALSNEKGALIDTSDDQAAVDQAARDVNTAYLPVRLKPVSEKLDALK